MHSEQSASIEHVDVLIVGAGISGTGAAYYLKTMQPAKTFAIVEARIQQFDPTPTCTRSAMSSSRGSTRRRPPARTPSWSTEDARWLVEIERFDTGEHVTMSCGW